MFKAFVFFSLGTLTMTTGMLIAGAAVTEAGTQGKKYKAGIYMETVLV